MSSDNEWVQATKALGVAMSEYRRVSEIARIAATEREAALVELNKCQERVEAMIEEMKKGAPPESHWAK